jgi:hypothetical protein
MTNEFDREGKHWFVDGHADVPHTHEPDGTFLYERRFVSSPDPDDDFYEIRAAAEAWEKDFSDLGGLDNHGKDHDEREYRLLKAVRTSLGRDR